MDKTNLLNNDISYSYYYLYLSPTCSVQLFISLQIRVLKYWALFVFFSAIRSNLRRRNYFQRKGLKGIIHLFFW